MPHFGKLIQSRFHLRYTDHEHVNFCPARRCVLLLTHPINLLAC